jgi:coenzyme PQQ precursor peptide PqqA
MPAMTDLRQACPVLQHPLLRHETARAAQASFEAHAIPNHGKLLRRSQPSQHAHGATSVNRHGACVKHPDRLSQAVFHPDVLSKETTMQWTTPGYTDLRFGFEITMYIANR